MPRTPPLAYPLALFLGLITAIVPSSLPGPPPFAVALLVATVIFGAIGLLLSVLWPGNGWRWGLWVVAPAFLLTTLGVASSGEVRSYLQDDLPYVVCGLVAAAVAAELRARRTSRQTSTGGVDSE